MTQVNFPSSHACLYCLQPVVTGFLAGSNRFDLVFKGIIEPAARLGKAQAILAIAPTSFLQGEL